MHSSTINTLRRFSLDRINLTLALLLNVLLAFQAVQAQTYTVLHTFTAKEGIGPSTLIRDGAGNLYGTNLEGGSKSCPGGRGCGTLFRLDPAGKLTVLHNFSASPGEGWGPYGALTGDASGSLYGTAESGGIYGGGIVYKFDLKTRQYSTLYNFGGPDGWQPIGPLFRDGGGNLYGTTLIGGDLTCLWNGESGCGTVFMLDPEGNETVLHRFTTSDGTAPLAGVIGDAAGNLYGTTWYGGDLNCPSQPGYGCGTIFQIDASGNYLVLHRFEGTDGYQSQTGLVRDSEGNLYGVTSGGGTSTSPGGTLFKLDTAGNLTTLRSFASGTREGASPHVLIRDSRGYLYVANSSGGDFNCLTNIGCGTVLKFDRAGHEKLLHTFTGEPGSCNDLTLDSKGNLYGTLGGDPSIVFELTQP
jgi:uncharacterized repeat protein (TIGR03803 family)